MIRILEMLFFIRLAGWFDYMQDAVKDFPNSEKFWLWKWVQKHPIYLNWYSTYSPLPFFEKRGYGYNAGVPWLSNAWHLFKHGVLLSWSGLFACAFAWAFSLMLNLALWEEIILQGIVWLFTYWFEGRWFCNGYKKLKEN